MGRQAPLRVVQWTTGIVGTSALRSILDDRRLELVGVFAHSPSKVGQDAGVIAGREPVGVVATDDVDALLSLQPDCIVYMPHWPDISVMERILGAAINVVTTARLANGEHYPDDAGKRLAAAADAGGATLCGTGMNPMLVPTVALAATGMCTTVRHLHSLESLDCALRFGGHVGGLRIRQVPHPRPPTTSSMLDSLPQTRTATWATCRSRRVRCRDSTRAGSA